VGVDGRRLPPEVETAIYRIVQEAMTNAAKYAAPARVSVLLQARGGQLSVIVEDDGRGFDVQQVLAADAGQSKLGLYGMQERAELVGGHLEVESEPGAGTTVYLRVPMNA
jgi:signal transduction histidine kinase